ncbi:acetate--CoA ligase family protein [Tropicimonas sp. IMCC6043]|uniref:acetate--CoA ligase family protein n=1 Tax=Tropicimonas sp. IMCC6043 TaxID=2510645 RepID=UPI00101BE1CD|nr:acetate--CoA ligase family protein [Tropicimonas sp. IMCC6043]RYH12299.1 CoA-binding protein [Tropicimonas sp. IMCC6043]
MTAETAIKPAGTPAESEDPSQFALADRLAGLMNPQSVAIVGASARSDGWSGMAMPVLRRLGFKGKIYPVNPKYDRLNDLPCYPSISAIPGEVDAALMFVPRGALPGILDECGQKGVRGAVILAAGFSETGEDGRDAEAELREVANRNGIAVCGPNCLGLANLASGFMGLTAATFPDDLSPGRTALVSQSGQLMMVLLARAHDQGVHLRYLVSAGNELNVEAADYAGYALQDPEIASVAIALEGLRTPLRFLAVAERAQQLGKPLIVLKLGRSAKAAATALAHTGKMAGAFRTYDAVFRQHNIVSVNDPLELADVAALFEKCPAPRGNRLSVVTFSGGWSGVVADQAEVLGIPIADFTEETVAALKPLLDFTPPHNPLDLSGNVMNHPERWPAALRIVLEDANTDVLMVFIHQVREAWRDRLIQPLLELSRTATKPIVVIYDGGKVVEPGYEDLIRDRTLPVYRGPQPALQALKRFLDYHARRRSAPSAPAAHEPAASPEARSAVAAMLAQGGRSLAEHRAKAALAAYGLPMVEDQIVHSPDEALSAADRIGYPVVLKGLADGLEHKSDAGLVRLGLSTTAEIEAAFADLASRLKGHTLDGAPAPCLVQQMVRGGVEAILGMQNDPDFGPMILVGVGGVMTELLEDVALRRAPLTTEDARQMIDETRLGRLLDGFRGAPRADRAALETAILRLSDFALDHADAVQSIDINPVIVLPEGSGCVAVDGLIVTTEADR